MAPQTFNPLDSLDGGGGVDTLKISSDSAGSNLRTPSAGALKNIERIEVRDTNANNLTLLNLVNVTGVTDVVNDAFQPSGQCAVGALALVPWPLSHGLPPAGVAWGWLAGLGMLHTGLAYVVLYAGMARLGTGRIAVLQFVHPATAVLVDWAVYGRALTGWQLVGVGLIGLALWSLRRSE